ncbi:MAG: N-acetylmuramoyl-L-alanine amidase [Elusimicrobia bacterium]|nr:N-acetylmuramoyl-L-alanine amidase [Elusimicrobiota bacterium]
MLTALLVIALSPAHAAFPAVERSTAAIAVVYPTEGEVLPMMEGEFVLGSVSDPKAPFSINGASVTVHPDGAYLAWLALKPGTFTIHCELALKEGAVGYTRTIVITPPPAPLPDKPLAIDKDSIFPKADLELRAGDWLIAKLKSSPGAKVKYRLPKKSWQPMAEVNPALGLYEGVYQVQPGDEMSPAQIEFQAGSGWSAISAKSQGKAAFLSGAPPIAVVKGNGAARLKTGPGEGELFPGANGMRFIVAGRLGSEVKLQLPNGEAAWLEAKYLEFQPQGTAPPRAATDVISVKAGDNSTVVHIGLTDRVPFRVDEAEDGRSLTVRIYYAWAHTNWVVYADEDPLVQEVRFKQENADTVAVTVRLKPDQNLWGYHASYEGSAVRLELRRAPRLAPAPASALEGVAIFVDPGHMPSAPGAIGPLGTREMDVNYAIAKALEEKLTKQGAKVFMSRKNPEDEVGLPERPRQAWEKRADLFISVHNNFMGDGSNPFKGPPHGSSVFYYHPHSLALARAVYQAYDGRVPLPGEALRFGDLLVARMTEMPAILTESAYLLFPEQEALLLDARFRDKIASAIAVGTRRFLETERQHQGVKPAKRAAPPAATAPAPAPPKPRKGKRRKKEIPA